MSTITIDTSIFKQVELYARLHNVAPRSLPLHMLSPEIQRLAGIIPVDSVSSTDLNGISARLEKYLQD